MIFGVSSCILIFEMAAISFRTIWRMNTFLQFLASAIDPQTIAMSVVAPCQENLENVFASFILNEGYQSDLGEDIEQI